MAKQAKREASDATAQEVVDAIHAGKLSHTELTLLRALVDSTKNKAIAEQRVLSLASELGASHAKLWTHEAKHAPKKRGRPTLPRGHVRVLEKAHFRVLERLAEAEPHGLLAGQFQLPGLTGKTLQRVLQELRGRLLADLVGKRWFWTPTLERLQNGQ